MQLIGFTTEEFFDQEEKLIIQAFNSGIDKIHLRKPGFSLKMSRQLIEKIPENWHHMIIIHDHPELLSDYNLGGIHLNRRNTTVPSDFKGSVSSSLHSISELKNISQYNYVTLSPIFDSISKKGYTAGFDYNSLMEAKQMGLINSQVLALGGIILERIELIKELGFGGVAILGYLCEDKSAEQIKRKITTIKNRF